MNRAAKGQVRWNKRETGLNQTTLQTIMYPLWNLTATALKLHAKAENYGLQCISNIFLTSALIGEAL